MSADNGITIKKCLDRTYEVFLWQGDGNGHLLESFPDLESAVRFGNEQQTEYGIQFMEETAVKQLDSYYVQFRDAKNDQRYTCRYAAEDFAHAEEQAKQDAENLGQIVSIDLDYK